MADRPRAPLHRLERPRWSWAARAVTATMLAAAVLLGVQAGVSGSSSVIGTLLSWSSDAGATPPGPAVSTDDPVAADAPNAAPAARGASRRDPGSRPAYTVVGLGDSVPAAAECGCTSFVSLLADQVAQRASRSPVVDNLAVGGETTSDLIAQLQQPDVISQVAAADLVVVTIGANDFDPEGLTSEACEPVTDLGCYEDELSSQQEQLTSVLSRLRAMTGPDGAKVLVTGYWNVFLDGEVGRAQGPDYVAASDALTRRENSQLAAAAAAGAARFVDLYTPFKGDGTRDDTDLLAPDGDHPDAAGHELIARTLLSAVLAS